ncbi:energy-coupling factor ABC transporter ATP-binding protein, partial [Desulfovibrio sp. OttesenSCG-928-M16]|nr:energy-coupling factor ABC transporter ATP-binding protein [Desulfovibrio sp. OttesenSCG-928-M16]
MNTPLFALEGVSFTRPGGRRLLEDVSLALYPGECLGITGRNGSGKSTLLHIGAGLLKPDKGLVRFGPRICAEEKDFVQARKNLGYLLQRAEDQLFCATVLEDVAFGPYNLGHSSDEAEALARDMLDRLQLSHLADQNGQRLSGGEQKL